MDKRVGFLFEGAFESSPRQPSKKRKNNTIFKIVRSK